MRILIVMQSSTEDFYQNSTALLKRMYNDVIRKKNLPIDVISYVGNADETKLIDDTLYINCDNKLSIDKHKQLYKFIYEHKEYDVVIKTNVSTVLNLELISRLVISNDFYPQNVYCASIMWDSRCHGEILNKNNELKKYGNFPVGYFIMAARNVWEDIYMTYDDVVQTVVSDLKAHNPNRQSFDINDDLILGPLFIKTCHDTMQMSNFILFTSSEMEPFIRSTHDISTFFSSICVRCKLHTDSPNNLHMRELYEPFIMELVGKAYFEHDISFEDLNGFISSMGWFIL